MLTNASLDIIAVYVVTNKKALQKLVLRDNSFTSQRITALSNPVLNSQSLEILDLAQNPISIEGHIKFLKSIQT